MKKSKGTLCADIILCIICGMFLLVYFVGIYYAIVGMPDGFYHEGPLIYGIEAFCDQFFWCSFALSVCGIIPVSIAFEISLFAYKMKKKTLLKFEKIILTINSVLFLLGVVIGVIIFLSEI